jgi:hypothetical protein
MYRWASVPIKDVVAEGSAADVGLINERWFDIQIISGHDRSTASEPTPFRGGSRSKECVNLVRLDPGIIQGTF